MRLLRKPMKCKLEPVNDLSFEEKVMTKFHGNRARPQKTLNIFIPQCSRNVQKEQLVLSLRPHDRSENFVAFIILSTTSNKIYIISWRGWSRLQPSKRESVEREEHSQGFAAQLEFTRVIVI